MTALLLAGAGSCRVAEATCPGRALGRVRATPPAFHPSRGLARLRATDPRSRHPALPLLRVGLQPPATATQGLHHALVGGAGEGFSRLRERLVQRLASESRRIARGRRATKFDAIGYYPRSAHPGGT